MAQILVPGTAQAVITGTYVTQPWAVVWHFKYDNSTANWSSQEVQSLADQLRAGWNSAAAPLMGNTVHANAFTVTDIGSTAPTVGTNTTVVTGTGGPGTIENASIATLISFKIGVRYKGGHPRTYLPWGTVANQASEFQWATNYLTQSVDAMVAIINNIRLATPPRGSNLMSHVVPRYVYQVTNDQVHQKYVRQRTGLKSVDVVQTYQTVATYGVQRRRLRA